MDANANLLQIAPALLAEWLCDARQRSLDLIVDLDDDQLLGPRLAIVNPPLWEIGHLAWFAERWVLRHAGQQPPLRSDADALYDSSAVPRDTRWDLPLPSHAATLEYLRQVQKRVLDVLDRGPTLQERYFILLAIFHEDMHGEAFFYTRQTFGYPRPTLTPALGGGWRVEGGGLSIPSTLHPPPSTLHPTSVARRCLRSRRYVSAGCRAGRAVRLR